MNRRFRATLFAAALTALPGMALAAAPAAAAAPGQGPHSGRWAQCKAQRQAKLLPTYDTNRDGVLDKSERRAAHQDMRQKMIARFDTNRDGTLDPAERQAMRQERKARRFERLDLNKDGAISRAEAQNASCSPLGRFFDKVDTNGDGVITATEMAAARPPRGRFGHKGRFGRHHGRFDRDGAGGAAPQD